LRFRERQRPKILPLELQHIEREHRSRLFDGYWYVCVRRGGVEALWPITARGAVY
jgi:hypothetical protein